MYALRGMLSVLARIMIAAIFLMSAVGNKIPNFNGVAKGMADKGLPQPNILLAGAIAFLILGSLSIVLGYRGRTGAFLLLVFLAAATYYYHDFWKAPPETREKEVIQFFKNVALMGTMVFIIANGTGPWSLSNRQRAPGDDDAGAAVTPRRPIG
ncbi:MAG: DoxX family protein [Planctomycetaceae bacterium]